ncbi:MAG: RagB/SusD family nutrient uptake outer membrane protein [Parabacteroides sp.]
MTKNIFLSLLAGASLICSMPSCTDLDEDVYDKLPAESFGESETELNALVGVVYKTLKLYFGDGNFIALDEETGSSAMTPTRYGGDWYDSGQYIQFYMHTWTSQTSCIKSAWSNASTAIGTCNANIQVVENSTILPEAQKNQMVAEMRGVRAFWIYKMMDEWGNIPLVTDYSDKELPVCQPRQTVYDWLLTEINSIVSLLPDREGNYAKFTKGAAYTLFAKLYLNAEAWGVTVNGNAYQLAADCCDKVMAMGYVLEPNWKDNFSVSNENSREAILSSPFSSSDTSKDTRSQLFLRTLHYLDNQTLGASFGAWNGVCAQPDYARLFEEEDPRFDATYLTGQQYNISTGEKLVTAHGYDLNHTIDVTILPGTERDGTPWGDVNQHDGARCQKWEYTSSLVDAMENDFHIFRLADVYLMKAEALLRSGGSVSEATNLVNAVRERAFGNSSHNYSTVGLNEILLERRLELAWEMHNRQDDIRFGVYDQGMWSASNCQRASSSHLLIFPISQDAWQSNPNLTQNPGYPAFN